MGERPTIQDAAEMLRTIAELRAERDELFDDAEMVAGEHAALWARVVLAEERAATAEAGVAVSETFRRYDVAEIDQLTAERDALRTQLAAAAIEDVRRILTAKPGVSLEGAARAMVADRDALAVERDKAEAERDALRERLAALEAAFDSRGHTGQWEAMHAAKLRAATERADAAERERDAALAKIDALTAERDALRTQVERMEQERRTHVWSAAEFAAMHHTLQEKAEAERDAAVAERDSLRERLDRLREAAIEVRTAMVEDRVGGRYWRAMDALGAAITETSPTTWRAEVEAAVLREAAQRLEARATTEDIAAERQHAAGLHQHGREGDTVAAVLRGEASTLRDMAATRGKR